MVLPPNAKLPYKPCGDTKLETIAQTVSRSYTLHSMLNFHLSRTFRRRAPPYTNQRGRCSSCGTTCGSYHTPTSHFSRVPKTSSHHRICNVITTTIRYGSALSSFQHAGLTDQAQASMQARYSPNTPSPNTHPILVLYYSNNILSKSLPELAAYVSLGIAVVNFLMTFPPIFLIEVRNSSTTIGMTPTQYFSVLAESNSSVGLLLERSSPI